MKTALKNGLKKLLQKFGYSASRVRNEQKWQPSFAGAIERVMLRDPSFQSVIDVGAAVGDWSSTVAVKFPGREHLFIEANAVHASALTQSVRRTIVGRMCLKRVDQSAEVSILIVVILLVGRHGGCPTAKPTKTFR